VSTIQDSFARYRASDIFRLLVALDLKLVATWEGNIYWDHALDCAGLGAYFLAQVPTTK